MEVTYQEVSDYYGKELSSSEDLKTNACCTPTPPPRYIQSILDQIHPEIKEKYYGCGMTIPFQLEGMKVLDLGSGSGRDCYLASALVGEKGFVTGIDMTEEQLAVARKHIDYHTKKFGYSTSNIRFLNGNIDQLASLPLQPASIDIIISNCVINLCKDKQGVLNEAFNLLKPGGEMYFSDVYCDRRISKELQEDPVLYGECLSGALYWNDFLRYAQKAGFTDPRVVASNAIDIQNEELKTKVGNAKFFSVTYRLFKIDGLEGDCEDYGQSVRYKGTISELPHAFDLDNHHHFPTGKMITVCGNTYKMLYDTRFRDHFEFFGSWDTHYGIFEGCGGNMPFKEEDNSSTSICC